MQDELAEIKQLLHQVIMDVNILKEMIRTKSPESSMQNPREIMQEVISIFPPDIKKYFTPEGDK